MAIKPNTQKESPMAKGKTQYKATPEQELAVVKELNENMGWKEEDFTNVEEIYTLPTDDFAQEEIDGLSNATLVFFDATCKGFKKAFKYELTVPKKVVAKKEAAKSKPAPKKGDVPAKAAAKGTKAVKEVLKETKAVKATKGKAVSIIAKGKPHRWDCRFAIYTALTGAPAPLSIQELVEVTQIEAADKFQREFTKELIKESIVFHLPMYIYAGLVVEDLTGEVATYSLGE